MSYVRNIQRRLHSSLISSYITGWCLIFNTRSFILVLGFDSYRGCNNSLITSLHSCFSTVILRLGTMGKSIDMWTSSWLLNVCMFCWNNNLKNIDRGIIRALYSKCCPWTKAWASPESLLEMQNSGPYPSPSEPVCIYQDPLVIYLPFKIRKALNQIAIW